MIRSFSNTFHLKKTKIYPLCHTYSQAGLVNGLALKNTKQNAKTDLDQSEIFVHLNLLEQSLVRLCSAARPLMYLWRNVLTLEFGA